MKKFLIFSIFTFFFVLIGINFIGKMAYNKKDINILSKIIDKEVFLGDDKVIINGINIIK